MRSVVSVDDVLALADGKLASILRRSQRALGAALKLLAGNPGAELIDDEYGIRFFNRELPPESAVLAMPRSPAEVGRLIDAELERFAALGLQVDWCLFPAPMARDMATGLAGRGLTPGSTPWLVADLSVLPAAPTKVPGLRIERAETSAQMADWERAFADGFGTVNGAKRYHDAYVGQPRTDGRLHHVAYAGERPVACSTLLLDEGLATVWDVATAPDQRRRGYGAALVHVLIEEAHRAGCSHASLNSSPVGRAMYRSLGFDLEVAIPEFRWAPPSV